LETFFSNVKFINTYGLLIKKEKMILKAKDEKKEIPSWIIWIPLLLIVLLIFPKPCGTKLGSETIEYKCIGIKSILNQKNNTENPNRLCYGACFSERLQKENKTSNLSNNITIDTNESSNQIISDKEIKGLARGVLAILPVIIIISIIIALLSWLMSKKKESNIIVIKKD